MDSFVIGMRVQELKSEAVEKLFLLKWSWVSIPQVWHVMVIWNSIEEDFARVLLDRNAQTWGKSIKLSFVVPTYTQPLYTSFLMKFNPNSHRRVERNLAKNERKTLELVNHLNSVLIVRLI